MPGRSTWKTRISPTFRLKIGNLAGALADLEHARAVADADTAAKIQAMIDKLKP